MKNKKNKQLYEINGDKLIRMKKICPRCGPGTFMADHGERFSCGKCGYTEWKRK
ncbi:MAG: 30S ribosomal protein S27ae [Candidatus Methanofastidiosia archaeon]